MKLVKIILFFVLLFLVSTGNFAQTVGLSIKNSDKTESSLFKSVKYKNTFSSVVSRDKEIRNVLFSFYDLGYLNATVDSTRKDSLNLIVYMTAGKLFRIVSLGKGNVDDALLSEVGFRERFYKNSVFHYPEISKLFEALLTYCENNGYPFAVVKLDSVATTDSTFKASINLRKNTKIVIDTLINKGSAILSEKYLYLYLGIRPGDLYNESKIRKIDTRLRSLPFINLNKPTLIRFSDFEKSITIFADKRNSSQFDGVIGFLPNSAQSGKLLLSGEAHLKLLNALSHGELFDLNWRRLQEKTQDLNVNIVYPFLFATPFGIDYKFYLYKKDTSYITLRNNFGIQYLFSGNNYLKAFVDNTSSSLLKNSALDNLTTLPPYADITTTLYGLELKNEHYDYIYNPRKGYHIKLTAAVGNKVIKQNDKIKLVLYDSLKLRSTQYQFESNLGVFLPVKNRSTVYLNSHTTYLGNPNLFDNELFRIGGLKTLRGFDEESIHASFYSILNLEYRYLLEKNSYVNLFWNGCYYEKSLHNSFMSDHPYGFGAGITFETKAGIFSVTYALGSQSGAPVNFRSSKIHFGIVSYF